MKSIEVQDLNHHVLNHNESSNKRLEKINYNHNTNAQLVSYKIDIMMMRTAFGKICIKLSLSSLRKLYMRKQQQNGQIRKACLFTPVISQESEN